MKTCPSYHNISFYQSSKGRRPGADDIDASSRLPLLSDSYYRDVLGEYGAFFALAYRIDRVHKNAWIGFQSWRASAKKVFCCYCLLYSLLSIFYAKFFDCRTMPLSCFVVVTFSLWLITFLCLQ